VLVCGVRPCVIVVRDSVIVHALPCPQYFGSRHSLRLKQVLCDVCMWGVKCRGHSEPVQGVRVAGDVPVRVYWGMGGSQVACWAGRYRVFFGRKLCVCGCGGMCYRGVGEGSPVLLCRAGQLPGVGDRSRSA